MIDMRTSKNYVSRIRRYLEFSGNNYEFAIYRLVLAENLYCLIFLTFFRRAVNLKSSVIVAAEENSEP